MNSRDLIIENIEEAIEQLRETASELRADQEYDEGHFASTSNTPITT